MPSTVEDQIFAKDHADIIKLKPLRRIHAPHLINPVGVGGPEVRFGDPGRQLSRIRLRTTSPLLPEVQLSSDSSLALLLDLQGYYVPFGGRRWIEVDCNLYAAPRAGKLVSPNDN